MRDLEICDLSISDFARNAEQNRDAMYAIDSGLTRFNRSVQPDPSASPLVLAIYGSDGGIVAGILGRSGFQAPDLYKRMGYEVFGELKSYPEGYDHVYFKKELIPGDA